MLPYFRKKDCESDMALVKHIYNLYFSTISLCKITSLCLTQVHQKYTYLGHAFLVFLGRYMRAHASSGDKL